MVVENLQELYMARERLAAARERVVLLLFDTPWVFQQV